MNESPQDISFFNVGVFRNAVISIGLSFIGGLLVGMGELSMRIVLCFIAAFIILIMLGGIISKLGVPQETLFRHLQAVWLFGFLSLYLGIKDFIGFILSIVFAASYIALGGWMYGFLVKSEGMNGT